MSSPKTVLERYSSFVRSALETCFVVLSGLDSKRNQRFRQTWPSMPGVKRTELWESKQDIEAETFLTELIRLGQIHASPKILKVNRARSRFVYKAATDSGGVVVKFSTSTPVSPFGHLNNMAMEEYVHTAVPKTIDKLVPKLRFVTESGLGVEYIEGVYMSSSTIRALELDELAVSGIKKLHRMHAHFPGNAYSGQNFSRDLSTLVDYWSQARNPSPRRLLNIGALWQCENFFNDAIERAWLGFEAGSKSPQSSLCAWDLSTDNLIIDRNKNLWIVDTEDFRFSLPVFDYAHMSAVALGMASEPVESFHSLKLAILGLLQNQDDIVFWRMYEGLLVAYLCNELLEQCFDGSRERKHRNLSSSLRRLRPVIKSCLNVDV